MVIAPIAAQAVSAVSKFRSLSLAAALVASGLVVAASRPACAAAPRAPHTIGTRYLIRFTEAPLARYNTMGASKPAGARLEAIPLRRTANGRMRLDVTSPQALNYLSYLASRQQQHLGDIARATGRPLHVAYRMRHALNAVVLELDPTQAERVRALPGVAAVEPDRAHALATDISPGFLGASSLWWGTAAASDALFVSGFENAGGSFGDGIVIGDIDTGYNSLSPSFQPIDATGYHIRNPLGSGHFLGQCSLGGGSGGISLAGCNDKVIGAYDEIDLTGSAGPATSYSVEDTQNHGSHTASTAAGDRRRGTYNGYTTGIAGIAPHANLVIYYACSPLPAVQCTTSALTASIDQAIQDGVVDALNYSISGGTDAWYDAVSLAFLSATDAGIFVAAAAGNESYIGGQLPGTVNNVAPWVATAAAATHTGGNISASGRQAVQPDELAFFSLLGPVAFDVIKPDLQAPGVDILAAIANSGGPGGPNLVGLMNGTSMATPHLTGSAALLLGSHPDWTPAEVKSALMMTAKEAGLTKADGTTPSDYFDRGAGRPQDFAATRAGLVLDATGLDFDNADPAKGGDPRALNLASLACAACIGSSSFVRRFRSTQDHLVTWTPSVAPGSDAALALTFGAASFPAPALQTAAPLTITLDTSALASDGAYHFAEVVLTPDDPMLPPLHLPVAAQVPHPTVDAAPNPIAITGVGSASASATLTVFNRGGPTLNVAQTTSGTAFKLWARQTSAATNGYASVKYTSLGAGDSDAFAAEDFTISGNVAVDLADIAVPGYGANRTLASFGPTLPLHWRIYASLDGLPSSDPDTGGAPVWSYDATAGSSGVSVSGTYGSDIALDLTAAGTHTALAAGHYWLVVYPTLPCNDSGAGCSEGWFWFSSDAGSGAPPVFTTPQTGPGWAATDPTFGAGLALRIDSIAACTPPAWLGAGAFPLALGGAASATLSVTAIAPLGSSHVTGYLCLNTNDPITPVLPVQVNAAQ